MDIVVPEVPLEKSAESLEITNFITTGDQYLTFALGEESYGVDILSVKEIRGWEEPTMIPHSNEDMKGVINMRGAIVPIMDLRIRFRIGEINYDPTTVVIVLRLPDEQDGRIIGFVVDAVSDVLNADDSEIKKAPDFASTVPYDCIRGLVNVDKNVVTLLNLEKLMNFEG